jgi:TolB-like protein/DNA-binding winged helix-turn-helix (wHTH) protein/Tfp pilus assembly protein PilF
MESGTSPLAHQFRLDRDGYQLLDGSSRVRLEKQPMELLILLAERKDQLVTRDEIAAALWGNDVFVDTDRNINSIVRKLRQALQDDPDQPRFLETVVGKGYRFIGPLEILPSRASPANGNEVQPVAFPARGKTLHWKFGLAALAIVIVAGLAWLSVRRDKSAATEQANIRSLAVLSLANVSGDASQEYFADGITQELTAALAQVGDLRVISHTSVRQYKDGHRSIPEIANDLHVDALIEGSVIRSGDRVRVTAQLIRAPADRAVWANTYERDLRDVLVLQRDIAEDIAEQVKIKINRNNQASSSARPVDPEAHDAVLQGLFNYDKGTEEGLTAAIADYQAAIARDPNYAAAYAGMADAYVQLGVLYQPPPQAMPQAKAAALKALELDPDLSAAHVSLGNVHYYYEWDWAAAEREVRQAIELNPSNAYAHDLLAEYYGTVGRCNDNVLELQRARELAPVSVEILGDTVMWAFLCRNYDQAISKGEAITATQPYNSFAQVFLGMSYAKQGHIPEALQHADLAVQYDKSPLIASFRANVYALAGRKDVATAALADVEKRRVEQYSCSYEIGTGYVLLGQTDRGFRWLDNAYQSRSECMILVKVDPRLDSVRSDPRYQTLLRRVGLAD